MLTNIYSFTTAKEKDRVLKKKTSILEYITYKW